MCLIIHRHPDAKIPEWLLTSAISRNRDGWGIMYAYQNQVSVTKGFTLGGLIEALEKVDPSIELFVHLRMATHGVVDETNTHPFSMAPAWFMHNGILRMPSVDIRKSDTHLFAEMYSDLLLDDPEYMFTEDFAETVNYHAGSDRLLFLLPDGRNIKLGKGAWTSPADLPGLELSNTYAWSRPSTAITSRYSYSNSYSTPSTLYDFYDDEEVYVEEADDTSALVYTLEQLQRMSLKQIEDIGWSDPSVLAKAIHASSLYLTRP